MAGFDAYGTTIGKEGGTPGTYVAIGNVTEITPPGLEREALDVTAHDSPDGWREYVGGLKNGGEVTLTINYDPAKHDTLLADFDATAPGAWEIQWPAAVGGSWQFDAIMTGFAPEAPHDDKLTAEITLQVTGKPTFDDGEV